MRFSRRRRITRRKLNDWRKNKRNLAYLAKRGPAIYRHREAGQGGVSMRFLNRTTKSSAPETPAPVLWGWVRTSSAFLFSFWWMPIRRTFRRFRPTLLRRDRRRGRDARTIQFPPLTFCEFALAVPWKKETNSPKKALFCISYQRASSVLELNFCIFGRF